MKNRMKKVVCALLLVQCIFSLAGCSSTKLAEGFDEKVVEDTAEQIINEMQVNGVEKVLQEKLREDRTEEMNMEAMAQTVLELVSGKGAFLAYSQETVIGKYHDELKEDLAIILVTATYEKGEVNYTLSFDKDMQLVGFYAK